MRICHSTPEACAASGLPRCATVLDGAAGSGLRSVMGSLIERAAEVAVRWRALAERARIGSAALPEPEETAEILEAAGSGDTRRLCTALAGEGFRIAAADLPLHDAILRAQLFVEACTLSMGGAGSDAAADALGVLGRFTAVRITLLACAYEREEAKGASAQRCRSAADGLGLPRREQFCGIIGASAPMQALYAAIEKAARRRETVLIVGESGTGKELVARAIHAVSGDPTARFVAANCAAFPRELLESELFGHTRGAFSGAVAAHAGLVRAANGGTLFLDEIAELPPGAQAKLLRVLQERSVRGLGETAEVAVDARFVAATNVAPERLLADGRLRRDLFYRLQRTVITLPPLRERMEDLPLLVDHFVARWQRVTGGPRKAFSDAALARLLLHRWPGNVRELENAVLAAADAGEGPWIRVSDLPRLDEIDAPDPEARVPAALPVSLRAAERVAIQEALHSARGNKALASRVLGISRKQLYVKLRLYGLDGTPSVG